MAGVGTTSLSRRRACREPGSEPGSGKGYQPELEHRGLVGGEKISPMGPHSTDWTRTMTPAL